MERVISGLLVISLAVASYILWDKNTELQEDIAEEIERGKISITSTILSDTTEFTFMKITNQFVYYMDKKGEDMKKRIKDLDVKNLARWKALYKWEYPFHFGFKVEDGWDWCIKVNEKEGVVSLYAPKIKQLNDADASPKLEAVFNSGTKKTQVAANKWMISFANSEIHSVAKTYLENDTVQNSIKKSLAAFFQEILNDAHEYNNPISKVIVKTGDKKSCKK